MIRKWQPIAIKGVERLCQDRPSNSLRGAIVVAAELALARTARRICLALQMCGEEIRLTARTVQSCECPQQGGGVPSLLTMISGNRISDRQQGMVTQRMTSRNTGPSRLSVNQPVRPKLIR